jgi:hypothetical protein
MFGVLIAAVSLVVSGCNLEGPAGCTSSTDCRDNRLCSAAGECLPPGAIDRDAGVDGQTDSDATPSELAVAVSTLRDRCRPDDGRIVEFEFSFSEDTNCGIRNGLFVRVTFESPGWGNSPGEVRAGEGEAGRVQVCTPTDNCVEGGSAVLNINSYLLSEDEVRGSYEVTLPDMTGVPDEYAGEELSGDLESLQLCSASPAICA